MCMTNGIHRSGDMEAVGEDGLGVRVLVADSLLAREELRGHEAGQARLLTLAQVDGDTLRQYCQMSDPPHRELGHEDRGQVLISQQVSQNWLF